MDTFASLFDEASRDVEAEGRERIVTAASQAATSTCWPFLSLAQSEAEFGHRLALVEDRLATIASEHGLSYEEVTAPLVAGFKAVLEAREAQEASEAPKGPDLTAEAAGAECKNCGHVNPTHRKGGLCECGCDSYQPTARTAAIRTYDEDQGVRFQCPDCHGIGMSYDLGLTGNSPGIKHCDTCKDSGTVYRFRKADSDGGYSRKDFDFRAAPKQASRDAAFDARLAAMHQALMEGQDPLAWIQQQNGAPSPANAEKPGGHMTTQVFEGEPGSTFDRAMAQGGGTGTPENSGGHSTAPATRQATKEPDPFR